MNEREIVVTPPVLAVHLHVSNVVVYFVGVLECSWSMQTVMALLLSVFRRVSPVIVLYMSLGLKGAEHTIVEPLLT